jgi:hypothetical protein
VCQQSDQTLGPVGGLTCETGRDGARDLVQLTLDRDREVPATFANERVEASHRSVEAGEDGGTGVVALPVLLERDDLTHAARVAPGSDRDPEATVEVPSTFVRMPLELNRARRGRS